MEDEQLKTIFRVIKNKDEETINVLNKIKGNLPLTQCEADMIILPLESYFSKSIASTENEIEKEYGYGAKTGLRSHQNAYKVMKKVLVETKGFYDNIIRCIKELIK